MTFYVWVTKSLLNYKTQIYAILDTCHSLVISMTVTFAKKNASEHFPNMDKWSSKDCHQSSFDRLSVIKMPKLEFAIRKCFSNKGDNQNTTSMLLTKIDQLRNKPKPKTQTRNRFTKSYYYIGFAKFESDRTNELSFVIWIWKLCMYWLILY